MTFEEQFPSFNLKKAITLWNSGEWTRDKEISRDDDTAFTLTEIKNNCLDKAKVREAIDKCEVLTNVISRDKLLKELDYD